MGGWGDGCLAKECAGGVGSTASGSTASGSTASGSTAIGGAMIDGATIDGATIELATVGPTPPSDGVPGHLHLPIITKHGDPTRLASR